ncbi:CBS domain-containing protein [Caenimonas aquaedulcis]|uniref:CBS domain-containing protein n=1 Tax=Caenimonas aquaedulcis TaxID=2793270 RepID=A0A931H273_9BURK|nr:CBS domain-containing protein [Caenimonas aquaedulcis]MBG9387217.1 CBS domain-containing protein [Caenimonas aquaedulcis]
MHKISDVMSRDVKVIAPDATIGDAAKAMRDGDFGMMPVSENDKMVGAISDRDIAIRAIAEGRGPDTKVRDIMSDGIHWVYDDESVDRASKLMSEHQIRRLPVVDRDKRLVGIVALADLAVKESESRPASQALTEISEPA